MNLFELFSNMNNRTNKNAWVETTARFTGKTNKTAKRTKAGYIEEKHNEYEIVYEAEGKQRRAWYTFYPVPDPEVEDIKGTRIDILYKKSRPYIIRSTGESISE